MNTLRRKIVLGLAIFFIALCPLMFFAGMFAPRALGFLDTLICPEGAQISNYKYITTVTANQGVNTYTDANATDLICVDRQGNTTDVTASMLLILFGVAAIGAGLWLSTQRLTVIKASG